MIPKRNSAARAAILAMCAAVAPGAAHAQLLGTAFSYQGKIKQDGVPVNGFCDLEFELWADEFSADAADLLGVQLVTGVEVSGGVFTLQLNEDSELGADAFDGGPRWLEVSVCCDDICNPADFTTLPGRQQVTASPYATRAREGVGPPDALNVDPHTGNVGIGTGTPTAKLDVAGRVKTSSYAEIQGLKLGSVPDGPRYVQGIHPDAGLQIMTNTNTTNSRSWIEMYGQHPSRDGELTLAGTYVKVMTGSTSTSWGTPSMLLTEEGDVGIGTETPEATLHVEHTFSSFPDYSDLSGSTLRVVANGECLNPFGGFFCNAATFIAEVGDAIRAEGNLTVIGRGWFGYDLGVGGNLNVGNRTRTGILEITGGSDLSERFDIEGSGGDITPGSVVCIDPANSGQLRICTDAYDHTVAGVVSGAGGVKTGMLMGQIGTQTDGEHPVALTGRVYVRANTLNGSIKAGDLLTTSTAPGYAMKATDHTRAGGATLGKAMSTLTSGEGLVLVLVALQ